MDVCKLTDDLQFQVNKFNKTQNQLYLNLNQMIKNKIESFVMINEIDINTGKSI